MIVQQIIDVHAHVYPAGCFTEVIKTRAEFRLVDNPRGQSLLYHGSHVMSMPTEQDNLPKRLASMDEAGIGMAVLSVGSLNNWQVIAIGPACTPIFDDMGVSS